jgi:alpha-galactosidase
MKNSTEIGKEYEWTYAGNGEFRLSKGGRELFLAYAAAESTDGRSIDTRHAKEDNVPEDGTPGKQFTFRTADGLVLREDLYLDEAGLPCVSCTLSDSCSREVTTRKLIPLIAYGSETEKTGLWKSLASEMLLVPYDNTMWSRYETAHLRPGRISYDLSELISGYSKKALLFGALDFDVWKNAVVCSAYDSRKLELRSGIADGGTHDSLPHGAVSGPRVTSSRFVVLYGGDYRDLLEQYGEAVSRMTSPSNGNRASRSDGTAGPRISIPSISGKPPSLPPSSKITCSTKAMQTATIP